MAVTTTTERPVARPARVVHPSARPVLPAPPGRVMENGRLSQYAGIAVEPLSEVLDKGFTFGWYSEKGGGKTSIAATTIFYLLEKNPAARMAVLDVEGGTRSIKSWPNIDRLPITSWPQFVKLVDQFALDPDLPWGAISADNLTELSDLSMDVVLRQAHKQEPEWPEWRLNSRLVVTQIRRLRDLARARGLIVHATLWDRTQTDDAGNVRRVGADLNPKLASLFAGAVDLVGWIEPIGEGTDRMRAVHLGPTSRVSAKFRQDQLDPIARGIPLDMYWRLSPDDKGPLLPMLRTILEGKEWPKGAYAAPEGIRSRFSAKPPVERAQARAIERSLRGRDLSADAAESSSPSTVDSEGAERETREGME